MGTTYRFIADPSESSEVMAWFRSLPEPPIESAKERGFLLYFKAFGPLAHGLDGTIDVKKSPLVTVVLPQVKRGVLWTVGEVHFLATPLRRSFPALHRLSSAFSKWLSERDCVFSNDRSENPYRYYLEGSIGNYDAPVFAFESGLRALQSGRYFVGDDDTDFRLDKLCQALRLRGIECGED